MVLVLLFVAFAIVCGLLGRALEERDKYRELWKAAVVRLDRDAIDRIPRLISAEALSKMKRMQPMAYMAAQEFPGMQEFDEEWDAQCVVEQGGDFKSQIPDVTVGRDFGDECDREGRDAEAMRFHAELVEGESLRSQGEGSRVKGQEECGGLA